MDWYQIVSCSHKHHYIGIMTCATPPFTAKAKQRLLWSVFPLSYHGAKWRFTLDPPSELGLCVRETFTDTPTVALPSSSHGCRPGSFDHHDHRTIIAESALLLLLRLIRPPHQPLTKAFNVYNIATCLLGLINSVDSLARAAHPPLPGTTLRHVVIN